jgi:hypothetical protein
MLLANLLRTLSEDEMKKIREGFRLPERSRLIFERIAITPSSLPDSAKLAKAIQISKENLYRLCSQIVDECVRILAPKEEFSTLKFYRNKYLYRAFITEMHHIEKQLLKAKDGDELERFYEFVFLGIFAMPVNLVNLDLVEKIGQKWHKSKKHPPVDDGLYIQLRIIFMQIASLPSKKKMNLQQMSEYSRRVLSPLSAKAESSDNPLVRYQYYQNKWKACIYERTSPEKQIAWLTKSAAVMAENKDFFESSQEEFVRLQIAYELASSCNQVAEGMEVFRSVYQKHSSENSWGPLCYIWYIRIAFLAEDFETTRLVLANFEKSQSVKATPTIYITVLIMKAKLGIMEKQYDTVARAIEEAKSANSENFFLAYEVQIRGLEAVLALRRGDISLADQLAERNMKWLWSRKVSLGVSAWIYFYQIIQAIIMNRQTGEHIKPSLVDHFRNDFRDGHPDFYLLLENEIEKYRKIKNPNTKKVLTIEPLLLKT